MESIKISSYGKINLALDVINKRNDGYHNISTVMQEISLKDDLTIIDNENKKLVITSNNEEMPLDERNLVYKVWEELKKISGLDKGAHVHIYKRIPVAAGLAGGSSNAAAMLKGLNSLWKLDYPVEKLEEIGKTIGADIPFCLRGGTLLATGIGDQFKPIPSFQDVYVLLVNPNIPMDTKYVYGKLDLRDRKDFNMDLILQEMGKRDILGVAQNLYNLLEVIVTKEVEEIEEIKGELTKNKALGSLMSGSGTTVFGLFKNETDLNFSYEKMKEKYPNYRIIKTKTR